jgi:hypothetical protein
VAYKSIALGSIESSDNFQAKAKSKTDSPELDLNMNFDPEALFTVTRALAVEAGLDPAPLDGIVELGGYQYLKVEDSDSQLKREVKRQANLYRSVEI